MDENPEEMDIENEPEETDDGGNLPGQVEGDDGDSPTEEVTEDQNEESEQIEEPANGEEINDNETDDM